MKEVRNAAVLKVLEGDEVGANDAGVVKMGGFLPPEGLAGRECKREGELRLGDIKRQPFGGIEKDPGFLGRV